MKEHGICAKCKKSVGCPYADDRITGCKNFVLEPELKLTNKEWLRNADTEQLAEWIAHQTMIALLENQNNHSLRMTYPAYWVEWLKQPHTAK